MIDALKREIWDECGASVVVEKLFFIGSNTCTYEGYNGVKMVPTKVVFGFICKYAEKMWEEHLYDLADFILKIDGFDERLAKGDPALVNINEDGLMSEITITTDSRYHFKLDEQFQPANPFEDINVNSAIDEIKDKATKDINEQQES